LKGTTKEVDKIGDEDEDDDYQRGVDDNEDDESKGIQVWGTNFGRMHKWAV
jgi:hypothetical protein